MRRARKEAHQGGVILELAENCRTVGLADDIALVVAAANLDEILPVAKASIEEAIL